MFKVPVFDQMTSSIQTLRSLVRGFEYITREQNRWDVAWICSFACCNKPTVYAQGTSEAV
jgi:hypothetical protein